MFTMFLVVDLVQHYSEHAPNALRTCHHMYHACAKAHTETLQAAEVRLEHGWAREPDSEDTISTQPRWI